MMLILDNSQECNLGIYGMMNIQFLNQKGTQRQTVSTDSYWRGLELGYV